MFDPWVSLLGDGSEDAAYLQALASVPRAEITCLRFTEGKIHSEKPACNYIRKVAPMRVLSQRSRLKFFPLV